MPRFDWYAATIRDDVLDILPALAAGLGGEVVDGKPRNGYTMGHHIKVKDSNVATVFSGGRNGNPHAFASGDDAPAFAELVRTLWPVQRNKQGAVLAGHHVTRMDVCLDFDGPNTWDRLYDVCLQLAQERNLTINQAGDWVRLEAGRTFYIGSPSSAVRLRLYEKGKQMRGLAIDGGADISDDWVRFEVVVRPDKDARFRAAEGAPVEAFGYADWSRELLRQVEGVDVERVHVRERRESDHERAMFWLMRQYGEHLAAEAENVGGWDKLGPALFSRFQATREEDGPEADLGKFRDRAPRDAEPRDYMDPDRPF